MKNSYGVLPWKTIKLFAKESRLLHSKKKINENKKYISIDTEKKESFQLQTYYTGQGQ